jgi:hypothetical protein
LRAQAALQEKKYVGVFPLKSNGLAFLMGRANPVFSKTGRQNICPTKIYCSLMLTFVVFTDMINRWSKFYSTVPAARDTVEEIVHEWFEQQLVETVLGLQALKGSKEWDDEELKSSWSEEALTTAVMARYHIDFAVKRALGSKLGALKEKAA